MTTNKKKIVIPTFVPEAAGLNIQMMMKNKPKTKQTKSSWEDKEKEVVKTYLRICRDQHLNTFDWLRDLYEKNALDLGVLREWQKDMVEANDKLRKTLIKKFGLHIE